MFGAQSFGDPSTPTSTAADRNVSHPQPFSRPLGSYTGAPTQTQLTNNLVGAGNAATCIVPLTRENRFVTLVAPLVAFTIYIGTAGVSINSGHALTPGLPYEISLPGNQALYAVSNCPVALRLNIQIAAAMVGDLERRL